MTIFNIYSGQLGEQQFAAIAHSIGSTRDQAVVGSSQIVPILVSAMARIARSEEGAKALSDLIDRDHNGSILTQLPALYANPNLSGGDALLSSVLGNKRADAEHLVSNESHLSPAATNKLFIMTTSIVFGMIGMKKRQDKIDAAMLAQMLNTFAERHEREESGEPEPQAPAANDSFFGKITAMAGLGNIGGMLKSGNFSGIGKMITNLLDKNKDGSVMDDISSLASGFLGSKK